MKENKLLIETWADYSTDGIFNYLNQLNVPWKNKIDPHQLDFDYYLNHSGRKTVSYFCESALNLNMRDKLADSIFIRFNDKWTKIFDAINTEYDPLDNYNMVEDSHDVLNKDGNNSNISSGSDSNISENKTTGNSDQDNLNAAFNSSSPVLTNESNTDSEILTKSEGSITYGKSDNLIIDETDDTTHHLTRKGNIGVTTSQQMLQSEIDLRSNYIFFEQVFIDIDTVLTIGIY